MSSKHAQDEPYRWSFYIVTPVHNVRVRVTSLTMLSPCYKHSKTKSSEPGLSLYTHTHARTHTHTHTHTHTQTHSRAGMRVCHFPAGVCSVVYTCMAWPGLLLTVLLTPDKHSGRPFVHAAATTCAAPDTHLHPLPPTLRETLVY